jgi:hypothetical protein
VLCDVLDTVESVCYRGTRELLLKSA